MRTLSLFRHAKSSWDDRGQSDAERSLNARGRHVAPLMGRHMAASGIVPDRILCSSAVRTRETAALTLAELAGAPVPEFVDALYLAPPATLLAHIRRTEASVRHLMLIGHNPGLHELALELAQTGPRDDMRRLAGKLPTAALVVIEFDVTAWSGIRAGSGRLVHFATPRLLGTGNDDD